MSHSSQIERPAFSRSSRHFVGGFDPALKNEMSRVAALSCPGKWIERFPQKSGESMVEVLEAQLSDVARTRVLHIRNVTMLRPSVTVRYGYIVESEPIWLSNANNRHASVSLKAIFLTVKSAMEAPNKVRLNQIDVVNGNPEHIAAVLRSLYSFRDKVENYRQVENQARLAFRQKSIAVEDLLQGLED